MDQIFESFLFIINKHGKVNIDNMKLEDKNMKKFYLVATMIVLSIMIAACGQNNDNGNLDGNNGVTTNDGEQSKNDNVTDNGATDDTNQNQDQATASDDMVKKMESLEYIDFELDVKYKDDQDYEVDLELENNRVDAKLEDDLNGIEIEGDRAFDEIYPLIEKLTIDQNTSKEDVISQVLDVFDLPTDYNEFELDIKFKDGTKVEFKDRK